MRQDWLDSRHSRMQVKKRGYQLEAPGTVMHGWERGIAGGLLLELRRMRTINLPGGPDTFSGFGVDNICR